VHDTKEENGLNKTDIMITQNLKFGLLSFSPLTNPLTCKLPQLIFVIPYSFCFSIFGLTFSSRF